MKDTVIFDKLSRGIVKDYLGVSLHVKVTGVINDENKFEVRECMNEHQEDFIITNV